MFSLIPLPVWAASESLRDCGVSPAPSLVICDPANLRAEAIEASVRKHTAWQVECATTDLDLAAVAAAERGVRAIVFDTRRGTPAAGVRVCVHKRDVMPDFSAALRALNERHLYRSPIVVNILARTSIAPLKDGAGAGRLATDTSAFGRSASCSSGLGIRYGRGA